MNDETLTLYYYDELSAAERREVEAALAADAALAERYRLLREDLDGLMTSDTPSAPSHLVAQWHDSIDRAAATAPVTAPSPRRTFHFGSFFWGAAVAASLAIGIGIGVFVSGDGPSTGTLVATTSPSHETTSAFSRSLLVHFRDSRDRLSAIEASTNGNRRQLVQDIVDQNRLFVRMAENNESRDLARVLRAFEPVLLRLAAEDVSPAEAERLLSQLQFELTIVLTKLSQRVSEGTDTSDSQELTT